MKHDLNHSVGTSRSGTDETASLQQESFAPITPSLHALCRAGGVALANTPPTGRARYVCTPNPDRVVRMAHARECRIIGVNAGGAATHEDFETKTARERGHSA
ncbi:MAG: aldehyde dehydrogenase family protein [Paracoccaceae bacterium]